jgi:hypothetical protein
MMVDLCQWPLEPPLAVTVNCKEFAAFSPAGDNSIPDTQRSIKENLSFDRCFDNPIRNPCIVSMNRLCLFLPALVLAISTREAGAVNIAGAGTAIMGVNSGINSSLGTPYIQFGTTTSINDGNTVGPTVDTYNGGQPHVASTASYSGITWATPRTDFVTTLSLTNAAFFDGGWFGPNNSGPGASNALTPAFIIEPTIQITVDGGTTWTNVAATSNYSATMSGAVLPVAFGPPTILTSTFTLTAPVTGINGIRFIGSEGGTASGGFLGVTEIGVNAEAVPEPASMTLAGFAGVLLLRRRRD